MSEQLRNYIEKERKSGFKDDEIKNVLIKAGYPEEEITMAFTDYYVEINKINEDTKIHEKIIPIKYSLFSIILILIIIISLSTAVYFIINLDLNKDEMNIPSNNELKDTSNNNLNNNLKNNINDKVKKTISEKIKADCLEESEKAQIMCKATLNKDKIKCEELIKDSDIKFCKNLVNIMIEENSPSFCYENNNENYFNTELINKLCPYLIKNSIESCELIIKSC